ncbi:hypothetical protein G7067_02630 [Leucobacter insecticola]|uniref:Uncharacterized protein n=1 Tax=Leucobacter insecticola TaxID=2714934 RepID=A0A6G8FGS6_9MICO|nr:hypothetical protein [Leucobacter insecticola]QIM15554.1 hypothetical protein G7067_02630 [Leucobacter insecticola]
MNWGQTRRRKKPPRRDWAAPWVFGTVSLMFAAPMLYYLWAIGTGRALYDGQQMLVVFLLGAAAVALLSWIPHVVLIGDGYLPKFSHDKNTPFTFWYFVITLGICAMLLGLAPVLPLLDGYRFADDGLTLTRGPQSMPIALWIVAPPVWALSALLSYLIGRGLWRHYRPETQERSDPALHALAARSSQRFAGGCPPPMRSGKSAQSGQRSGGLN